MESHFSKLNELVASAPLPPKLRAVADYVINNLDTCRFLTAIELAEAINVSYSTVIRLAKKLGFSGYPDFRNGGNANYEIDEKAFVKDMNEFLKQRNISAKFMVGKDRDDEAISFGVKSTKKK